jgi:hypothetical protein
MTPRFRFDGVRARVFPLRADPAALQRVCDRYLNLCPDEVSFRPAAPYALLGLLHYRRMSEVTRRGWVSQHEACFSVPLVWGRVERGRWRALGSAVVTPFVFVDQPQSVELGRQIYGWPKHPAELRYASEDGAHVMTLLAPDALVEVDRTSSGDGAPALWRDAIRTWSAGYDYLPWLVQAGRGWPAYYTANLRQVRSLEDPALAVYQAITMAPLEMTALHRTGMLGDGYRVQIHRDPRFPIVETLGLGAATLRPVFPFWFDADFAYGAGTTALWRSPHRRDGAWHVRAAGRTTIAAPSSGEPRFDPTWGGDRAPASQLAVRALELPATPQLARVVAGWQLPPEAGSMRLLDADRPRVVLVVSSAGAQHQVAFFVPVIWSRDGVDTVALVSALTFTDGTAADTDPEALAAEIEVGATLLSLTSNVLPVVHRDTEAEPRLVLEVHACEATAGVPPVLPDDLCVVARRRIRDATDPDAFAYEEWFHQRVIARNGQRGTQALAVHVHPYPAPLDLVGQLALATDPGPRSTHMINVTSCATLDVTYGAITSLAVRIDRGPWVRHD